MLNRIIACFTATLICVSASMHAETVVYSQVSNPAGFIDQTVTENTGVIVSSVKALPSRSGYYFTHWTSNTSGISYRDLTGRSLHRISFVLFEPSTLTAHYLAKDEDSDADGVPDWFEIRFYGTLANAASSDTDGDGYTLIEEYYYDWHPNLKNAVVDGSHSMSLSTLKTFDFDISNDVRYQEYSQPTGYVASVDLMVERGTYRKTAKVYGGNSGMRFVHWVVNGVRIADITGRALPSYSSTLNVDTTAIAHYMNDFTDSDLDSVPDWYELHYYGSLSLDAISDTDSDGFTLLEEYENDWHPNLKNTVLDGGASMTVSGLFVYQKIDKKEFTVSSSPTGLVASSTTYHDSGDSVSAQVTTLSNSGMRFTHWTVDGNRHADTLGNPYTAYSSTISSDINLVAHYYDEMLEADGDGVPDWFELKYYGDLSMSAASDSDGDGFTLIEEYENDYNPHLKNITIDGSPSISMGGLFFIDLQLFERLQYAKIDEVLTSIYTFDPSETPAWSPGANVSAAMLDWDGDGDFEMFIASDAGLIVYENIGTRYNPHYSDVSSNFSGLSSLIQGLSEPVITGGDYNRDGFDDLVIGGETGTVSFIASSGQLSGNQPSAITDTLDTTDSVALPALGDLNGDGFDDLVVLGELGQAKHYENSGTTPVYSNAVLDILSEQVTYATSAAFADVDDDDDMDLVVSDKDGRIWKYLNSGGAFTLNSKVWGGTGKGFATDMKISSADIDGDGDYDIIGGTATGALFFLRDPKLGRPQGLEAESGADSIYLKWAPDRQSRVKGYYVYRASPLIEGPFESLIPDDYTTQPAYLDEEVNLSNSYHYYVTAVTETYWPGNNVPQIVESLPSDMVSVEVGKIELIVAKREGKVETRIKVPVYISNPRRVSGDMSLSFAYDKRWVTPIQVHRHRISNTINFSDNAAANTGTWVVTGNSGKLANGQGTMITLEFLINAGSGSVSSPVDLVSANFGDTSGNSIGYTVQNGLITVTPSETCKQGDINFDGLVDNDDKKHMQWLFRGNTRGPTDLELCAGDLNGDGRITGRDLALLLRIIKGKDIYDEDDSDDEDDD